MRQARSRRRCQVFPAHPMRTSLRPLLPATYLRGRCSQPADRVDRPAEPAGRGHPRQPLQGRRGHCYLPPYKPFRCTYVAKQIAVKGKYGHWLTAAEREAMTRVVAPARPRALHRLWRHRPATNRIARFGSNLRPPLRRRPVASPTGTALRLVRRCCPDYARATWLLTQSRPRRRRYRLRMTQDWQDAAP